MEGEYEEEREGIKGDTVVHQFELGVWDGGIKLRQEGTESEGRVGGWGIGDHACLLVVLVVFGTFNERAVRAGMKTMTTMRGSNGAAVIREVLEREEQTIVIVVRVRVERVKVRWGVEVGLKRDDFRRQVLVSNPRLNPCIARFPPALTSNSATIVAASPRKLVANTTVGSCGSTFRCQRHDISTGMVIHGSL